jgi:hypothetical protein
LLKYDCIELVSTRKRRGSLQHFYRAKPGTLLGA